MKLNRAQAHNVKDASFWRSSHDFAWRKCDIEPESRVEDAKSLWVKSRNTRLR